MRKSIFVLLAIIGLNITQAQELPRCGERDYLIEYPRVVPELWCIENPLSTSVELDFTALAISNDGTFYATRPLAGQLVILADTNNDSLPDSIEVVAENLNLPNGLAVDGNKLFIAGDGVVYSYENGTITTIADDLPSGRGLMTKGIAAHNGQIYLGIPYPCDFCEADNELYGTVLRMDYRGQNRQIVANGLRYPAALTFYNDSLWVTDTARDNLPSDTWYDEINLINLADTPPHFGFPYCIGLSNEADFVGNFDCSLATSPEWLINSQSTPLALDSYHSDTFPWLNGQMLVALGGSFDNSFIRGYALIAVRNLENGQVQNEIIVPSDEHITPTFVFNSDSQRITTTSANLINTRGAGIWPHRIYDIEVSSEGWIYFSLGGKGIHVLRPSDYDRNIICQRRNC